MAFVRCIGGRKISQKWIFKDGQFGIGNGLNYTSNRPNGYTQFAGGSITHSITNNKLTITNNVDSSFPTAFTVSKIDLTNINSIDIDVDSVTLGAANCYMWMSVSSTNTDGYQPSKRIDARTTGIHSIDVSDLSGEYYFTICPARWIATTTITINSIGLN